MAGVFPSVNKISYDDLSRGLGFNDPDMAICWCQEHGLLSDLKECDMRRGYEFGEAEWEGWEDMAWQCKRPCQRRITIRQGTFLKTRICLSQSS